MTERKLRKLALAYAKLLAYDNEHGADEELGEIEQLIAYVLGKRRTRVAIAQLEKEYAGSGMEIDNEE
jgi:hypothetical protein